MPAKTRVATWGSSLAIRIPKPIAEQWGVQEGSAIEIVPDGDTLMLRKQVYDLTSLLDQVTPDNLHEEMNTGTPQGKEEW
ncbi:MAG: AbrB/MazE/SpoVT family DNA-binding domain-containing protein [Chloroflexota bacterium]|nr:AbrB/MazE/SpoVT family DNA-binding domain-containing protein [Chloroflexota bacterium]MDE2960672.1 AbrB/MazE/SpoVT family DNA-binding domain-containing protein [Chloroflexota bacterium]